MEKDGNNTLIIKAKQKNRRQQLLRRLMFGLKPSLRMAAFKVLMNKKRKPPNNNIDGTYFIVNNVVFVFVIIFYLYFQMTMKKLV